MTRGPATSGGAATTTSAGSSSVIAATRPAPTEQASANVVGETSESVTSTPRVESPSPIDAPTRPVPIILIGPVVAGASGVSAPNPGATPWPRADRHA